MRSMPRPGWRSPHAFAAAARSKDAPVLAAAAASIPGLAATGLVLTTMVFGHMSQYLKPFAERVRALAIPNVIVFTLDDLADQTCRQSAVLTCIRGKEQNALQKYIIVLAYLCLGWDVFWFDFDSVWLQNPLPYLKAAVQQSAGAQVLSAIDFDSKNCAMNAFFWIRAADATRNWLLALLHWIYQRPFVHDQLAYGVLLGLGPLVDEDPLPMPPLWAPLDPNVFANAARFGGLGFSSDVDKLVYFHFFDGWNSNKPEETQEHTTPTYGNENLFDVLYDQRSAKAVMEKSRLPPPVEFRDCFRMDSLHLGVETKPGVSIAVPKSAR